MEAITNHYETTYIINAAIEEQTIEETVVKMDDFIKEHGGQLIKTDRIGRKRLAYPIQKKHSGYYVTVEYKALPESIAQIERALQLDDYVLRFLTIVVDKKITYHREREIKKAEVEASYAAELAEKERKG